MTKLTEAQGAALAAVVMIVSIVAVGVGLLFLCEMAFRQMGGM